MQVGDVLLTYENEVVLTNHIYGPRALPYIVPRRCALCASLCGGTHGACNGAPRVP